MSAVTRKSDTHEERYVHVEIKGHPRVKMATVFARQNETAWFAAISFCHHQDQFDRRVGRLVARRRYFTYRNGKWPLAHLISMGSKFTYQGAVDAALTALSRL